ncbi:unnamed protein product, partial [Polarella glacialis]
SDSTACQLWLHSCHGMQAAELQAVLIDRSSGLTVAEAFAAAASSSEDMLGLGCQIADLDLVTVPSEQDTGTVITSLFVAEVCCAAFPSQQWADMAVVAIVPPQGGVGLRGTAVAGEESGGTAGWFIILQGMPAAQDIVDRLSRLGCLRNDLPQAFSLAGEGDCIIGEGAYATVYHMRARDGTVVAVKQMNQTADYESIEREVSTLIELQQSEFVIGYYGMFWRTEAEQSMFSLVFELAPCGDLLYKILKTGAMTETTIRPIFTGIIEGLNHVHAHNIVHRDIKTENILLKAEDCPVVADFGLACLITDEQQMTRRCGSPGFVAPEVCLGTQYDFKVDMFGAGVILYFMLSKEMPFSSPDRDSAATMRKTVKCSLHLHRAPWDEMTSRLRNVLRQLICKSQEDRLTAAGCLEHSWVVGKSEKSSGKKEKTSST